MIPLGEALGISVAHLNAVWWCMGGGRIRIEPDPVIEAYKKDLDLTLIRENLRRTVDERFERLMALQRFAEELRRAGQAIRR